nr:unnamed protein product [Callosobruchus analis]
MEHIFLLLSKRTSRIVTLIDIGDTLSTSWSFVMHQKCLPMHSLLAFLVQLMSLGYSRTLYYTKRLNRTVLIGFFVMIRNITLLQTVHFH